MCVVPETPSENYRIYLSAAFAIKGNVSWIFHPFFISFHNYFLYFGAFRSSRTQCQVIFFLSALQYEQNISHKEYDRFLNSFPYVTQIHPKHSFSEVASLRSYFCQGTWERIKISSGQHLLHQILKHSWNLSIWSCPGFDNTIIMLIT